MSLTDDVKSEIDTQFIHGEPLACSSEPIKMFEKQPRSIQNTRE